MKSMQCPGKRFRFPRVIVAALAVSHIASLSNGLAVKESSAAASRIRRGAARHRSHSVSDGTTSDFARALEDIDNSLDRDLRLDPAAFKKGHCQDVVRSIIAEHPRDLSESGGSDDITAAVSNVTSPTVPPAQPHVVHSGYLLRSSSATFLDLLEERVRLAVYSFLATQDLKKTKLVIWLDVEPTDEIAAPVRRGLVDPSSAAAVKRPELASAVELRRFDEKAEFRKVLSDTGHLLLEMYNTNSVPAMKSDLQRVAILYNYGGMWIDSDVLLIQDLTPLMGVDFAYLGEKDFINNAVVSVSEPQSLFVTTYLNALVGSETAVAPLSDKVYCRYGASILQNMFHEGWQRDTFHVLPPCFFDGAWQEVPGYTPWQQFFVTPIDDSWQKRLEYLYPLNSRRDAFAYHWHGHWEQPINNRSMAHALVTIYELNLGLPQ